MYWLRKQQQCQKLSKSSSKFYQKLRTKSADKALKHKKRPVKNKRHT